MTRNWSNLSHDILRLIVGKVKTLEDFTCICAVCSNWESGLEWSDFDRPQLPWLMLPCPHSSLVGGVRQCQCQQRRSFSLMENKVHHLDFPEACGNKCVGSSYGWMIIEDDPSIFMLNPLTKQRKELPPITTMPGILGFENEEYIYRDAFNGEIYRSSPKDVRFFVIKVILSNDPTKEEDCVAVAIYGQLCQLAFCRIGHDNKWTPVQDLRTPQADVIYFKGKFYAVNCNGMVGVFDVSNPQVKIIHEAPSGINLICRMYLVVDTTGGLLHISRWQDEYDSFSDAERKDTNDNVDHDDGHDEEDSIEDNEINNSKIKFFYRTTKFNVFKLDKVEKVWKKVRDVGDDIIFIGANQSICYSTTEYPEYNGNSIYFTDDYWEYGYRLYGGHDIGIYDINEGCGLIRKVPCFKKNPSFICPRPVWFTPSLRRVNHG